MVKLSNQTELTTIADGDLIPVLDVSDTTQGPSGTSKRITKANFVTGLSGGGASDATTGSKGIVQLAGDLAGTAASPTVPGLAAKAPSASPTLSNPTFTGTVTVPDGALAIADTSGLQAALDAKQDTLVSATNIKTINSTSLLGSGDIVISGGGGSTTPRANLSYLYDSLSRYLVLPYGSGSPTVDIQNNGLYIRRGTQSDGGTTVTDTSSPTAYHIFDKNPIFTMVASAEIASSGSEWKFYSVIGNIGSASSVTPTTSHIGFIIHNNFGSHEIIATNANGTTQTTTVNTDFNITSVHQFTCVMTSGTDIKFYVDGTLIATHTTNLPTGYVGSMMSSVMNGLSGTNNNSIFLMNNTVSYDAI